MSVNMQPSALESFLEGAPRLHVFDWAEQDAQRIGVDTTEVLRKKLGRRYRARSEFEARAGEGRHFHYGALNVGSMGAPRFGHYYVVEVQR